MARNAHDGVLALAAAEAALREGEQLAASIAVGAFGDPSRDGLYLPAPFGAAPRWREAGVWTQRASRVAPFAGSAEPPRYIVERVIARSDGSEAFRITARGVGGTRVAVAMVQSVVARNGAAARRLSWRELDGAP